MLEYKEVRPTFAGQYNTVRTVRIIPLFPGRSNVISPLIDSQNSVRIAGVSKWFAVSLFILRMKYARQ